MPRTRVTKTSKAKQTAKTTKTLENGDLPSKYEKSATVLKLVYKQTNNKRLEMKNCLKSVLDQIDTIGFEEMARVDNSEGNKTFAELTQEKSSVCSSILSNSSAILKSAMYKSFNMTKTNQSTVVKKKKLTEDEGYLTAGDSRRTASGDRTTSRTSRSKTRTNTKRKSRSLSKSTLPKSVTIQAPFKNTPAKKMIPANSFGFVTPKVKPNTTMSVLRHPKQGEMAISMQGSPLLVGRVITDTCANVNIPLQDGRIFSLQPSRSLRQSEIPDLDDLIRQQLRTLSENLNKVVKMANQC